MTITDLAAVRPSTAHDHEGVVTTLSRAFDADPVFRWLFDEDSRREAAIRDFFDLVVAALTPYGRSWTTEPTTGAALWVPAGEPSLDDRAAAALGELLQELGEAAAVRTQALIELMERAHPGEPHEYLWFLGVDPEHQGEGLGSALLVEGLAHADRAGVPCYLQATTPASVALYERHGFVTSAPLSVLDCPPLWPMRRPVGGR
jgi:ribosomal protein S18 acetylase RimI-like enzyme